MAKSPSSPFRHPVTNVRYTRLLFWDQHQLLPIDSRTREPMFTLHHDKEGLINLRRSYVALGDPTGYKLAQLHLEDYSHWQLLMKCPWFKEAKEIWDMELDAKLASEGLDIIRQHADGFEGLSPAVQVTAAKYLADKAYKKASAPASKNGRGRPSKEEVEGNLKLDTLAAKELEDDLARIRLVKG